MRRVFCTILFVSLLAAALFCALETQLAKGADTITINKDGSVSPPYTPISSVDNITYTFTSSISSSGDGIVVERSNIIIDGNEDTIQGPNYGTGINVTSTNNVTITNMNVKNFTYGIYFGSSSNNLSGSNVTYNTRYGIYLESSSDDTVAGNSVAGNGNYGVYLGHSYGNTLSDNNATGNTGYGFYLESSSNNTVSGNRLAGNGNGIYLGYSSDNKVLGNNATGNTGYGFYLESSSNNTVSENTMTANSMDGIYLDSSNGSSISGSNITANNRYGVYLDSSSDNSVYENYLINNSQDGVYIQAQASGNKIYRNTIINPGADGVRLSSSSNDAVYGNNITKNSDGIYLYTSGNNVFYGNNIMDNSLYGVALQSSSGNQFYHNDLANFTNEQQVSSGGSLNIWNSGYPSGGNYWSDYQTRYSNATENDTSGIWNTPYVIDANNTDYYPLMSPHDVAVTNICSYQTIVGQGLCTNMSVTVANWGTFDENVNLAVFANSTANSTVVTQVTRALGVADTAVMQFTWNTTGIAIGYNYTLNACEYPVLGGTRFLEHNCTGGSVFVTIVGDINGDGKVDMRDVGTVARHFEQNVTIAETNITNCDITGPTYGVPDGIIDMRDLGLVAKNFEAGPYLTVDRSPTFLPNNAWLGTTFNVSILARQVDPQFNLANATTYLSYNATLLQVENVTFNALWGQTTWNGHIPGDLFLSASTSQSGVGGDVLVATVTFKILYQGTVSGSFDVSTLHFHDWSLLSSNNVPLPAGAAEDGTVKIGSGG